MSGRDAGRAAVGRESRRRGCVGGGRGQMEGERRVGVCEGVGAGVGFDVESYIAE